MSRHLNRRKYSIHVFNGKKWSMDDMATDYDAMWKVGQDVEEDMSLGGRPLAEPQHDNDIEHETWNSPNLGLDAIYEEYESWPDPGVEEKVINWSQDVAGCPLESPDSPNSPPSTPLLGWDAHRSPRRRPSQDDDELLPRPPPYQEVPMDCGWDTEEEWLRSLMLTDSPPKPQRTCGEEPVQPRRTYVFKFGPGLRPGTTRTRKRSCSA